MMEITAIGAGMMMTAVAIVIGGLTLNAAFLILGRTLQAPPVAGSSETAATRLSQAKSAR